jgi:hypothetical protein
VTSRRTDQPSAGPPGPPPCSADLGCVAGPEGGAELALEELA